MSSPLNMPEIVSLFTAEKKYVSAAENVIRQDDVSIELQPTDCGVKVRVTAEHTPVSFVRLRWHRKFPDDALFLGDAWERSYGDLQWRGYEASRYMPWYFLMHCCGVTCGAGVKVRGGAMAMWTADEAGITLWLDLRCGNQGVILNGRCVEAAEVVSAEYSGISAFAAAREFCKMMCSDPIGPARPVYGGNNWYYAYGKSSHDEILADARAIAELCDGLENRPFMVIDEGWQINRKNPGPAGPWTTGNESFPDMAKLTSEMRQYGVRPGIWFRPLWNCDPAIPEEWRLPERNFPGLRCLDPSVAGVLEYIREDIRRIAGWGFELIKHDFSTYDMFQIWGMQVQDWLVQKSWCDARWTFADRGRTNAEIVKGLYGAIREAAGDTLILGCNTIGHLGAGLMHLARIGDDTSGREWERSCKMGVNTLAFRLCQHKTFFDADADCVGVTETISMKENMQWAELLGKSGTPLFASIKPGVLSAAEKEAMKRFFALSSEQKNIAEPLDWMRSATPSHWRLDEEEVHFDWFEDAGANPDFAEMNFLK
jgi:alpha-galactosidase